MTNDELLSQTISFLRFPLIVGVVFIHNKMAEINIQGKVISYDTWPWLTYTMDFFSSVLPTISVPLFFFISGFLFFYKVEFGRGVYIKKIGTRSKTLLVPYLIWNFVGFLILLIQMHPRFYSLFPLLKDYRIDITRFLSYFWIKDLPMAPTGEHATPINGPLWFIRDLILLVIATPVIYSLVKRLKVFFVVFLGVVWYFGLGKHIGLPGLCHQSIFFFPLGAYFSINRINFVELAHKVKWTPYAYIILAIGDTISIGLPFNFWFHQSGILVGLISSTYIASVLVESKKVKTNKFLGDASFFVFALHGLFIFKYMKAIVMVTHPQSPYFVLFIYFLVPITTILICLGLYRLLNSYMPSVAKIVTGGR